MNIGFNEDMINEFKSDRKKLGDEELVEAVVAFTNTDGGNLFLGIEDDGEITGLHEKHKDITQLAALIANRTIPPISVRTELIEYDRVVLKISVPKKTSIVATSSGKMLRRRIKADGTPENIPMYPYEIANRLSSLSLLDFSAQPVPDAALSDLDSVERERLRNIIRAFRGEQNLLELNDNELDSALQLVTSVNGESVPTLTGMLLIGKKDRLKALVPTAESAIQIMQGTDIKVNESYVLPLLASFEKISGYVDAYNREQELEVGLFRVSIPDIDKRAFRESLVNAFCHRDYSMLGRVRVQLDDEGMTISNPGGFIEGVSINNLLYAEPHSRNPVLADALKRIGLAERTGRGIDRIYEGSLLFGRLLPDYSESTERLVKLFIPKSLPDKAFVKMVIEEQKKTGHSLSIHYLLVLNSLKINHRSTVIEIADEINSDSTRVKVAVESLVEMGLVEAKGTGRGRYYMLSSRVYKKSDNVMGYVRQTDIDKLRYEELIIKLAKEQGYVTRGNVAELLNVSLPQAYRIIIKLRDKGLLKLQGSGKYAKYILI
ncbi:putative DNA binding domain-containing protein [bacterium 210820-DFI.6.37]|nr:putative DNA binding domain-containing protein [bacterium 210820-DFI.6.37]